MGSMVPQCAQNMGVLTATVSKRWPGANSVTGLLGVLAVAAGDDDGTAASAASLDDTSGGGCVHLDLTSLQHRRWHAQPQSTAKRARGDSTKSERRLRPPTLRTAYHARAYFDIGSRPP